MTAHPDNELGSGPSSGSSSGSISGSNAIPTTSPMDLDVMTRQEVFIRQLAKQVLHEKRSELLSILSKACKKYYKAGKDPKARKNIRRAYVVENYEKFLGVYAEEAKLRDTVHEVVPFDTLLECEDMIAYTCHESIHKAISYMVDVKSTYSEYHAHNPPNDPSPLYDEDIRDAFRKRERLRFLGPENWPMLRKPQLFFDPSPEAIEHKERLEEMTRAEKKNREVSQRREVPESVQEIARTSRNQKSHELPDPTPESFFSTTGTPLPGLLHGPFSMGWDAHENSGENKFFNYNNGISKTFGLIDFPHSLKTQSPVDITRYLTEDEAFKHNEILRCINEGGHFATTAHTYINLQKEIFLQFARRGGFNDIVDGAVDTRQLLDFTAGNKYHGRICPLWLHVQSGLKTDTFESLPHASDGSGQDTDNRDEDGDDDSVENLIKYGTIQYNRYIDFSKISSSSSKHPVHHPQHTRWTSVTPEGMLVPTHHPDHMELLVDIQVKSYSLADGALFIASGIHPDVIGSLEKIYYGLEARETRITGMKPDLRWDEFLALSTIYAVRVIGSMHQAEGEKQRSPFLIGMGGWVSPPRILRYHYENCKMDEEILSESSDTPMADASVTVAPRVIGPVETAKALEAAELEILSVPDTESRVFAAETAVGKMFPLVIPNTLLERSKAARYKDVIEPLMKEVDKQRAFAHTVSTLVHPSDITDAKDLPQADKSALRNSPQSIEDEIDRKVVFDVDEEAVPVWNKLADPALEDVMWMVHRLMTRNGISQFPTGRSNFGINWSMKCNNSRQQQKLWEQTCAFKSPSPIAEAHSRMLLKAYKDDVLDFGSIFRPQLPRPPRSDLWKATSPMHACSVEELIAHGDECRDGIEPSEETARLEKLMYRLYTASEAPADGTLWGNSDSKMDYVYDENTDDE